MRSALLLAAVLGALPASAAEPVGRELFEKNCTLCHQPDASGAPGLAPALAGTLKRYVASDSGKQYLAQILISGLAGRYESNGQVFTGLMPSFKDQLGDAEIAATLNYVLQNFNAVTEKNVVQAQAVSAARTRAPTTSDTRALRTSVK